MDSVNFNSLKNHLKYLGFGNSLTLVLEAKIREGSADFSIGATAQFDNGDSLQGKSPKDIVHYELLFTKSNSTDNYFITGLTATLEKGSSKEEISNTFYLGRGNDVTAKEAYNLLSGRSILKTVEISKKYDLHFINNHGSSASETKVSSILEAKDLITNKLKRDKMDDGYFQISDNGYPIRQFDLEGKDITAEPNGRLVLIHDYFDRRDGVINKVHYSFENSREAIDSINNLVIKESPDHETKGFRIYEQSGKILLYNYDKDGHEIDLSQDKRKEHVWIKLDFTSKNEAGTYSFKKFYENYGFNIEKELTQLGIKELSDNKEKKVLLASLGRGNVQIATLEFGSKVYLEANPQFKRVDSYDLQLNKIDLDPENKKQGIKR